jgi:hypothetical protein
VVPHGRSVRWGGLPAFWVAWYLGWAYSASNGRYGIGLLLLVSPLLVATLWRLFGSVRGRVYAGLVLLGIQATYALLIADPRGASSGDGWSDADLRVDVPLVLRERPVLHLTRWMTSWSFIAPWLHSDSELANLGAVSIGNMPGLDETALRRVIDGWGESVRVIDPVLSVVDGQPVLIDAQRSGLQAWLAPRDLAIDEGDCLTIHVSQMPPGLMTVEISDSGRKTRGSDSLFSCAVHRSPGASQAARAIASRYDGLFDAIERRCASQLGPSVYNTRWLGSEMWQRDYASPGLTLSVVEGKLIVSEDSGGKRLLGEVDRLMLAPADLDCSALHLDRPTLRRLFAPEAEVELDFSGLLSAPASASGR